MRLKGPVFPPAKEFRATPPIFYTMETAFLNHKKSFLWISVKVMTQ
jgi:hypothetical protein